ncbi:putative amino acid permease [Leucosporidium creatinivorum]|uniref:Putative amino acid permease n=1 Tax=Leucosporidium creatinivorum TaxID=106004 RepID=A0A1Y2F613_9BASI|nr:putative amino acid permease [Leucosporidium creatinivorum]
MASPAQTIADTSSSQESKIDLSEQGKTTFASNTPAQQLEAQQEVGVGGVGRTHRKLKNRHIAMIGFGSGIGTGLFVGTGSALANAGPLGLLLAYSITGGILWCVMQCIGEMATLIPTAGTFPHFATRFISPSVGFSLALSYFYCYAISVASELSAAAVLVSFWAPDLSPAVTISVGLVALIALNFVGVNWYGESEVIFSSIKILLFVGLIILGIVLDLGGGPDHKRLGFHYWKVDGPFQEFLAFWSAFINAGYTYIGIECVAIAAGEASQPSKQIPRAVKRVVWRILICYIGAVLVIGVLVSANDPDLVTGTGNANSSPFVIAIRRAGIPALPSIINAAVLTSAWSAGNSYLYVASRTLLAMSLDKQAPEIFSRVNKHGVPIYAVGFSSLFGFLAYLSLGSGGAGLAFTWLLNLSTIAGLIAWGTLCFAFIRFHRACKVQGVDRNTLPFKSNFQPYTAWFGFISTVVIIIFSGWSVFLDGQWDTSSFFASYIGIPIFVVPIIAWAIIKKTPFHRASAMDLWSGRLSPEDEVPEPKPTTRIGKFFDYLA